MAFVTRTTSRAQRTMPNRDVFLAKYPLAQTTNEAKPVL
jgi:hypothetical protein